MGVGSECAGCKGCAYLNDFGVKFCQEALCGKLLLKLQICSGNEKARQSVIHAGAMQAGHPIGRARAALRALHRQQQSGEQDPADVEAALAGDSVEVGSCQR